MPRHTIHIAVSVAAAVLALGLLAPGPALAAPTTAAPTEAGVSLGTSQIATGGTITGVFTVRIPDGTYLDGTWTGTMVAPSGASTVLFSAPASGAAERTWTFSQMIAQAGDTRFHVEYRPAKAIVTSAASGDATLRVRTTGASMDWSPGTVSSSAGGSAIVRIALPNGSDPVGGAVHLEVGTTADVAVCMPVRASASSAGCTLRIPAGLPVGGQPVNLSWQGSPAFQELDWTGALAITAAATSSSGSSGSTGSGGSAGSSSVPTTSTATPSPTPRPTSTPSTSPTSAAQAGSSSGSPAGSGSSAPVSSTPSGAPPVAVVVLAASLVLLLAGGVLAAILIRRARARGAQQPSTR